MNLKSIRAKNEWISNPQEPKMNEDQIYRSQKRMNLKSTWVQNEWISNIEEPKTNESRIC